MTDDVDEQDTEATIDTDGETADVLDRSGRSLDQLPLAAFDESTSKDALVREVIDAEKERDERLNAIGDAVADLETLVDGEPMVDSADWHETDPDLKRKMIEVRLDALVDDVEDAIDDAGDVEDQLRPETDRSFAGYQ